MVPSALDPAGSPLPLEPKLLEPKPPIPLPGFTALPGAEPRLAGRLAASAPPPPSQASATPSNELFVDIVLMFVTCEPGTELASSSARCCFDNDVKRVSARACLEASKLAMPDAAAGGELAGSVDPPAAAAAAAATAGSSKAKERRPGVEGE
jgi:hypothetical protein